MLLSDAQARIDYLRLKVRYLQAYMTPQQIKQANQMLAMEIAREDDDAGRAEEELADTDVVFALRDPRSLIPKAWLGSRHTFWIGGAYGVVLGLLLCGLALFVWYLLHHFGCTCPTASLYAT